MASHEYHFNSSKNTNLHTLIIHMSMQRCGYFCTVLYSVTKCSVYGHYNYKQRQSGLSGNPSLTISIKALCCQRFCNDNEQGKYTVAVHLETPQQRLARAIVCT